MPADYKIVLLDIEGTTTSISFVKEQLFPYARREMESWLSQNLISHSNTDEAIKLAKYLEEEIKKENQTQYENAADKQNFPRITSSLSTDASLFVQQTVKFLHHLMDLDKKVTILKFIQGKMWNNAYVKGEIKGHVYEEIPDVFSYWTEQQKPIYIYSSGSVEAQILLFKYSIFGDLETKFIKGHFDTQFPGNKLQASSYEKIAETLHVKPQEILFVTDNIEEARAATKAGFQNCILSVRQGTAPLPSSHEFSHVVTNFSSIKNDL